MADKNNANTSGSFKSNPPTSQICCPGFSWKKKTCKVLQLYSKPLLTYVFLKFGSQIPCVFDFSLDWVETLW